MLVGSSGGNVTLTLDASVGDDDPIDITAGTNIAFAGVSATGFTINATNTQLSKETVQDYIGEMLSGNTETRIAVTYDDNNNKINFVVDDMTSDNNTTYLLKAQQTGGNDTNPNLLLDASSGTDDTVTLVGGTNVSVVRDNDGQITFSSIDTNTTYALLVPSGTTAIRLDPSDSSGDDDVTITGGNNISVTRVSATELSIATDASVVATDLLNLSRLQFGPGSSNNDDANFQWLGGDNDGYLRISVSDDSDSGGTSDEYIEIGDYAIGGSSGANLSSTFTQWAKLARDELTMESTVRIKGVLKDYNGDTGTNGQVLVSTASGQINWVPATDVGGSVDTKYDLLVPSGTTAIRLEGNTESGNVNDDITITGGSNITVTRTSATELNIASSATVDITQLNLNRIRFGPGNAVNDDANIEWLGGNNGGYLRISTSDDSGTEYIELGDYDILDITGSFTQWAKLNRDEFYMARPVRLGSTLKDAGNSPGTNGQVLVSTGTAVDWVNASTVGGSVDNYADSLSFSGGVLTLGRTGSLTDLTASIPLSGITGDFTDLDDTPANYSGQANKLVVVNSSANGLTFATATSVATDNYYLTGLSFNTGNGVLTATVSGAADQTVDLDGRYVESATFSASIPAGSRMLFQQTAAPTGWTKDTGLNNRALRVVSGGVTNAGSNGFTNVFNSTITTGSGSVHGHILSQNEIPSHTHYAFRGNYGPQQQNGSNLTANNYAAFGTGRGNKYETYNITAKNDAPNVGPTSVVGGDGSHGHGFTNPNFNLNVAYTDVIICTKN